MTKQRDFDRARRLQQLQRPLDLSGDSPSKKRQRLRQMAQAKLERQQVKGSGTLERAPDSGIWGEKRAAFEAATASAVHSR